MVDMRLRDRRMLAESYHPKRDYMNTSPTIGVLLAAGAILLPSCETERVNERPIGIYPTENVYPSGAVGAQGDSLLNDIQRENSLDPMAGQNSGFNPDPARTNSGTIGNMVGGANNITPPAPVVPKPVVPNPEWFRRFRHCRPQASRTSRFFFRTGGVAYGGSHGGGQPV